MLCSGSTHLDVQDVVSASIDCLPRPQTAAFLAPKQTAAPENALDGRRPAEEHEHQDEEQGRGRHG